MKMPKPLCLVVLLNLLACEMAIAAGPPPQAPPELQRAHAAVGSELKETLHRSGAPTRGAAAASRPRVSGLPATRVSGLPPARVTGPTGAHGLATVGGPSSHPAVSVGGPAPAKIANRSVIGGGAARPR
ncbi:MAG: hypothetical protein JO042_18285 [Sinobacteraceae bacterium]|nr:hypothetical protein [Nevskiaceae bacterium]